MKKSLLSLAAVALMMSACTQDAPEFEGGNVANYNGNVGVTAVMTPETRTAMTENAAGSLEITWVAEDAIGLTGEDSSTTLGENVQYTANSSAASTTFSCAEATPIKWGEGNHTFYAYYPYTSEGSDYTAVPASVPAVQEQSAAGNTDHLQPYSFLYASYETNGIPADGNIDLQFKSAFSVLELEVCSEIGDVVCEGLIFRADDASEKVSASNVLVDLTDGSLDYSAATTSNQIKIDLGEGVTLNSTTPQKFYMLITPGHGGKRFSFYAVVGGKEVLLGNKGIPAAGLPAGRKAQLSLNVPVVNLSADGTANCYIVNKAGTTYKFKATVMGNGATTTGITPSTIAPTKARLARTVVASQSYKGGTAYGSDGTMNKLILRNSVELKDGYIYFTTPETLCPGNAIIYATDNNDKVLWSWHMWVAPNYNPYENMLPTFMGSVVMDRNLGAYNNGSGDTENDLKASIGLGYQWGRKDPFLISNIGWTYGNYQTADGTIDETQNVCTYRQNGNWADAVDMAKSAPDLAFDSWSDYVNYTIENPQVFIKGNGTNEYQWLSKAKANAETGWNVLWGNADYNRNAGAGVKTIYDPCPVGWKVGAPQDYGFFNIYGSDMASVYHYHALWRYNWDQTKTPVTSTLSEYTGYGNGSVSIDISQSQGYWVYGSKTDDYSGAVRKDTRNTYFPAPNNIESIITYTCTKTKTSGHLQIATNSAVAANNMYAVRATINPSGSIYFSGSGSTWEQQAAAVQVRCVKDATVSTSDEADAFFSEAIDLSENGTANTYIVNKSGVSYKFKATVKGNGKVQSIYSKRDKKDTSWSFVEGTAGAGQTSVTIAPTKSALLWYDSHFKNNYVKVCPIDVSSVQLKDGYIYFKTPTTFVDGNAVIAAYNEANEIVWSWQMWCCEGYDIEATKKLFGTTSTGYVMDRNLGATMAEDAEYQTNSWNAAAAVGMYYQHGRKDPFTAPLDLSAGDGNRGGVGAAARDANGNIMYGGDNTAYIYIGNTQYVAKIKELLGKDSWKFNEAADLITKYPHYKAQQGANTASAGDSKRDWWGSRSHDNEFFYYWGHPYWQNWTNATQKTIYDPCPAGWVVPSTDFLSTIKNGTITFGNYGWTVTPADNSRDAVYFPLTGQRWGDNWNVGDVTTIGGYWTSNIGDNGCAAYIFYKGDQGDGPGFYSTAVGGDTDGGTEGTKTIFWGVNGRAVRCVAENYR
ncbi:MAG: fimbrillin family protein [Rikenellaceae bacterium]|nr:fimbrillin family protein [Rikenellaceae bacterium]